MSWNGSSSGDNSSTRIRNRSSKNESTNKFCFSAIVIIVLLLVIGVVAILTDSDHLKSITTSEFAPKAKKYINHKSISHEEVTSQNETLANGSSIEENHREVDEKIAVIQRRQEKLKELRKTTRPLAPYEIFDHPSENRIAELLTIDPGTPIFAPIRVSSKFEEDFIESCKEPIIISAQDSEYVKNLKRDMIDCKIEICNRISNGETLSDILTEAHRELRRLGNLKMEVSRTIRNTIRESATSDDDVDMYITAANNLLESKGLAPMTDNPVLRRSFYRVAQRNAEQE